ncbi:hypothetical protein K438DRAFT_1779996 [Mycena galopus ATCC 62051]|nr:hypothetical protein K438DRAFT_1779996 [Mycena galopus ATCC 62051]
MLCAPKARCERLRCLPLDLLLCSSFGKLVLAPVPVQHEEHHDSEFVLLLSLFHCAIWHYELRFIFLIQDFEVDAVAIHPQHGQDWLPTRVLGQFKSRSGMGLSRCRWPPAVAEFRVRACEICELSHKPPHFQRTRDLTLLFKVSFALLFFVHLLLFSPELLICLDWHLVAILDTLAVVTIVLSARTLASV